MEGEVENSILHKGEKYIKHDHPWTCNGCRKELKRPIKRLLVE